MQRICNPQAPSGQVVGETRADSLHLFTTTRLGNAIAVQDAVQMRHTPLATKALLVK
jgi:hypothetical protein